MSVVERIRERQKSIKESFISLRSQLTVENLPSIKLSDFANLDCAIKIHSKVLNAEVWLCSDSEMEKQIQNDDPEAITYTVDELKQLIKLNPDPDGLRQIHQAKEVFRGSRIVECKPKQKSNKQEELK